MLTGLAHAIVDLIFLIDSDLEEEPEWLLAFNNKILHEPSCDVVYGIQVRRKGSWRERWSGAIFWSLINRLSGLSLPANIVTARLMKIGRASVRERVCQYVSIWVVAGSLK